MRFVSVKRTGSTTLIVASCEFRTKMGRPVCACTGTVRRSGEVTAAVAREARRRRNGRRAVMQRRREERRRGAAEV
jgi:hypothetical protein